MPGPSFCRSLTARKELEAGAHSKRVTDKFLVYTVALPPQGVQRWLLRYVLIFSSTWTAKKTFVLIQI
jgi:hypothetical protein